jgi:tRNA threonylcarbamoyladenosine biosynthesis protein TsaB
MILTIRTDKLESELGLFEGDTKLAYETWEAHRKLADTIHLKLKGLLGGQNKSLKDISGIVVFKGPGSFTGLRIGMSVANALAYSLGVPVAAAGGEDWIQDGMTRLQEHPKTQPVTPEYGQDPHITKPRK